MISSVFLSLTVLLSMGWAFHFIMKSRHPQWRVWIWRAIPGAGVFALALALWGPQFEVPVAWGSSVPGLDEVAVNSTSVTYIPVEEPSVLLPAEALSVQLPPASPMKDGGVSFFALLWLSGAGLCLLRLGYAWTRVRRLVRQSFPAPDECVAVLNDVRKEMSIQNDVVLRFSDELTTPCLVGVRHPVIILPESMTETEFLSDLRVVLSHELAHLKGADIAWGLVLELVFATLWFHPLAWKSGTSHCQACEEVADFEASELAKSRELYTQLLARVALNAISHSHLSLSTTMARSQDVRYRIKRLQEFAVGSGFRFRNCVWVMVALFVIGGMSSVLRVVQAEDQVAESDTVIQEIEAVQEGSGDSPQLTAMTFRLLEKGHADPEDEKLYIESIQSMLETLLYADGGKKKAERYGRKMWIIDSNQTSNEKTVTMKPGEEIEFAGASFRCVYAKEINEGYGVVTLEVRSEKKIEKVNLEEYRTAIIFGGSLTVIADEVWCTKESGQHQVRVKLIDNSSKNPKVTTTAHLTITDLEENLDKIRGFFQTLEPLPKKEPLLSKLNEKTFTLKQGEEVEYEGMLLRCGVISAGSLVYFVARGTDWHEEFSLNQYQSEFFQEYEVILEKIEKSDGSIHVKVKIRRSRKVEEKNQPQSTDGKYTEEQVKEKSVVFFFERIGDPEAGYHAFSPLWALTEKGESGGQAIRDEIFKLGSEIIASDQNMYRRWVSCYVLSGVGEERSIPVLANALKNDKDQTVRGVAACALGKYTSEEAKKILREQLKVEKTEDVKGWIERALEGEFLKE